MRVNMMNFGFKIMNFAPKMMNFALKTQPSLVICSPPRRSSTLSSESRSKRHSNGLTSLRTRGECFHIVLCCFCAHNDVFARLKLAALVASNDFAAVIVGVDGLEGLPGECGQLYEQLLDRCEVLGDGAQSALSALLESDSIEAIDAGTTCHLLFATTPRSRLGFSTWC